MTGSDRTPEDGTQVAPALAGAFTVRDWFVLSVPAWDRDAQDPP